MHLATLKVHGVLRVAAPGHGAKLLLARVASSLTDAGVDYGGSRFLVSLVRLGVISPVKASVPSTWSSKVRYLTYDS